MELLRTDRLILRQWEDGDAKPLIEMTAKEHIAYWLPEWSSCSEWALLWIQGNVKKGYEIHDPMEYFMTWAIVLKESNQLIGMVNIGSDEFDHKEVGTGYFIDDDYANKGYMTEALKALCGYVFKTYHYDHIATMIQSENAASIAVAQKAGFKYVHEIVSDNGGFDRPVTHKLFKLDQPSM